MKPGPKPLPAEARKVCRIILNLYPAEFENISNVALWTGMKSSEVVMWALRIGLPIIAKESETFDRKSA